MGIWSSKGFNELQLLLQKLDAGPLRLFTCLSLSVSTKCTSKENSRHQTATGQPGGGPGIVVFASKTCLASIFGCFWSDQRLKVSCHECIVKQQKPNVMMLGSFAPVREARRASTTWHLVHTERLLSTPVTELKCSFSSHNGFWTHLKCSCSQAFANTVDTIQVQSFH